MWVIAEFTGDLSLALDTKPMRQSPALQDSLDITSELAEPVPAAAAPSDQHPAPTVDGPPLTTATSSDQALVGLRLDLSKPSAAKGSVSGDDKLYYDVIILCFVIIILLFVEHHEILRISKYVSSICCVHITRTCSYGKVHKMDGREALFLQVVCLTA